MTKKIEARVPRGMRDLLPEDMVRRQYVMDVIREVFEEFGFEPLQTPAMELEETLSGKYGEEAERLIYSASYGGSEERLALRYDLSVPLSRVIAMYPNLPIPFKRYHLALVWRADRPQKGRYREFYQCDADTVGSTSMLGDAETIAVIYTILARLGFKEFTIYINNRKILKGIGQYAGVPQSLFVGLYRSIDKLNKIGPEGVEQELLMVGVPDAIFESIRRVTRLYLQGELNLKDLGGRLRQEEIPIEGESGTTPFPEDLVAAIEPQLKKILTKQKPGETEPDLVQEKAGELVYGVIPNLRKYYQSTNDLIPTEVVKRLLVLLEEKGKGIEVLAKLRKILGEFPEALEGLTELEDMIRYLDLLGVPSDYYELDVSMVRGLDYYTGPIYETIVKEPNIGSITGGGRYDELVGMFLGKSVPATGTSIGIERIIDVMKELDMFPPSIGKTATQVLVTAFSKETIDDSVKMAARLRIEGLRTQIYFDPDPLREQLGYAAKKEIPIVVIMGEDEIEQSKVTVRNLRMKEQETVAIEKASETIKKWL